MKQTISIQRKNFRLTGLHALKSGERYDYASTGPSSHIQIHGGIYKRDGDELEWTGESLDGIIPLKDLLEWGLKKRFLSFEKRR